VSNLEKTAASSTVREYAGETAEGKKNVGVFRSWKKRAHDSGGKTEVPQLGSGGNHSSTLSNLRSGRKRRREKRREGRERHASTTTQRVCTECTLFFCRGGNHNARAKLGRKGLKGARKKITPDLCPKTPKGAGEDSSADRPAGASGGRLAIIDTGNYRLREVRKLQRGGGHASAACVQNERALLLTDKEEGGNDDEKTQRN